MIATKFSTLRQAVITLLRQSGKSPLEAVELWDNVYSTQIQRAAPGTHRLLIGQYELEFTKPDVPAPFDLTNAIHQANVEAKTFERHSNIRGWIQIVAVLIIAAVIAHFLGAF